MEDPIDVSIVVISYNTRDVTLEALRSVVRETQDLRYEVIVLDNASSDGSAEAIGREFPQINLIASQDNLGFGQGNNVAAKHARGDFLLLLNPDTFVLDQAIDRIVAFAQSCPEKGIWGGRQIFADGSLNLTNCRRQMTLWGQFSWAAGLHRMRPNSWLFNYDSYGGWARDSVREVGIVSGCFLLIRRSLWEDLSGFDPVFFMYGEEADLCRRAMGVGARPTMTPEAEIIHYGGLSETVRADKMERLLRAKITFAKRHSGPLQFWMFRQIFGLLAAVRAFGFSAKARIANGATAKEKAATWKNVWQRRRTWLQGYDEVSPPGT